MMRVQGNWNKVFFMAAVLAATGAGGFLAVRSTGPARGGQQVAPLPSPIDPKAAEDKKAIKKIQAAYIKAFNAGDAKALAAFWAPDGEFVDADGHAFKGRNAIAKEFGSYFAESKGLKLEINTGTLRFLSPDVALESGTSRVTRESDDTSNTSAYHIVHNKRDGKWLLASVREAPYAPTSNYEQLRSLEWVIGNWVAKSGEKTLEFSAEWTAKRNFILRKYKLKTNEGTAKSGLQIIGWDPVAGGIRSWVFDSDGGFGSEEWTKDGKRWVLEATGVTRDGAEAEATNIIEPIDHDHFTWQSIHRTLNEVSMPDTALIKITRAKVKK